jgi:hypothetical protein
MGATMRRSSKKSALVQDGTLVRVEVKKASGELVRILELHSLLEAVKAIETLRNEGYRVGAVHGPSGKPQAVHGGQGGIAFAYSTSQERWNPLGRADGARNLRSRQMAQGQGSSNQGGNQGGGNQGGGNQSGNQSGNQGGGRGGSQQGGRGESEGSSERGFASMDPQKQREIAAEGGRAAHASGNAHEFTSEEAREAGSQSHKNDRGQGGGNQGGDQGGNQRGGSGGQGGGGR